MKGIDLSTENIAQYEALVRSIALIIYGRCVDHGNGIPEFEHFAENDLQEPPDILSRLGIMTDKDGRRHRHTFSFGWVPDKPLNLTRHQGEPTVFDLVLALCFLIDWDVARFGDIGRVRDFDPTQAAPKFDLSATRPFTTIEREAFCEYAFLTGCALLEELGLGSWTVDARFEVLFELSQNSPIRIMSIYRGSRLNLIRKLGEKAKLYPVV
ncbi:MULTISPECIES: hypothetical protein [unclassified Pseudovibrio]|uniref:hypothetical protein n=1 Tax=unclassified Pseudovibrio TaxID=2627060 RepID=UPI00128EA16B|nr:MULTISPECIES: hypothetical protein [unclassified Pseudovibrio]